MADFVELTHFSPILKSEYLNEKLSSWFNKTMKYVGSSYRKFDETTNAEYYNIKNVKLTIFGRTPTDKVIYKVHVVLKTLPVSPIKKKLLPLSTFLQNEIAFYSKILPQLLQFQADRNVKDGFDNVPRPFAMHSDGLNDFLIIEDLSMSGYKRLNPGKKMDQTHVELVIKLLANFHSLSFAFKNERLPAFDDMAMKLFESQSHRKIWKWYLKCWTMVTDRAIDAVKKEYPNSVYIKLIKEFSSPRTFYRRAYVAHNSLNYGCINHSQVWASNILVKYSEDGKTPLHAVIIDFENCCYASPVIDLSVFLFSSVEINCSKNYDSLLKLYYDCMSRQVRVLGSELPLIYPWHTYIMEVKKFSFFGLSTSFHAAPLSAPYEKELQNVGKRVSCFNREDARMLRPVRDDAWRKIQANNFVFAVEKGLV